uniref:VLRF1 domain-containing protein n=1 Tax=Pelodiscus sinensis TaxID=13735 RepID=K7G9J8_PELSI
LHSLLGAMQPPEVRSVWEAAQDPAFLHGLALVSAWSEAGPSTGSDTETQEKAAVVGGQERARGTPEISDRMCCAACSQAFDSREEQVGEAWLSWARAGQGRGMAGRVLPRRCGLTRAWFAGDISSISGSDSEGSGSSQESDPPPGSSRQSHPLGTRSARVLLRNSQGQLLSAYRCVLSTKAADRGVLCQGSGEQQAELVASLRSLGAGTCWVILMTGGGHFAGAVFRGGIWALAQSWPRRHRPLPQLRGTPEPSPGPAVTPPLPFPQDVQDLLASWVQHLQGAQRIFLRAPRGSRALLFGGRTPPLRKDDPRVCNIPSSPRRATLRELLRVHVALATLQVFGESWGGLCLLQSSWGAAGASPRVPGGQRVPPPASPAPSRLPEAPGQDEEEEEEESQAGELETVEVTLGTLQLREFEVMPKRSRKRRKKRDKVERGETGGAL